MSVVGCYSLDVCCHHPDHQYSDGSGWHGNTEAFAGYDRGEAFSNAREKGWLINHKEDKALCPTHSGKRINKT